MLGRLREFKEGDIFQTYKITKKLDDISNSIYRGTFECEDGILIVYDRTLVPDPVMIEDEGSEIPYEYYVMKNKQNFGFLPRLLSDGSDSRFVWMLVEKFGWQTLEEYIYQSGVGNTAPENEGDINDVCTWLIDSLHFVKESDCRLRLHFTPNNLCVSYNDDGLPRLSICNLHSAISTEYGLMAPYIGADSRFLAPEFLLGKYNEDSLVYNIALLVIFCLNGKMPDDDILTSKMYDDIATIQMRAEYSVSKLNISDSRKQLLLTTLNLDPEQRPTLDAFIEMWKTEKIISYGMDDDVFSESMIYDVFGPKTSNKFDNMFVKSGGNGFSEIGGMDDLKRVLVEKYINPIKYPEIAQVYNLTPPNGILLYGPPGCGKSFIAKKLCEELNCFYIRIKASDLGGQWHREGVSNIGALFDSAERKSKEEGVPIMIILDECDGFIQIRNQEMSLGAAAETNMFLTELDNCASRGIYVICTSNDPSGIDSAALRSGRIGESYYVPLPDKETKRDIMDLRLSSLPHNEMNLMPIIDKTDRFTSSDIAQVVELAASKAMSMMISNLPSTEVVKIDEKMITSIISEMPPSLTVEDIARHEQIHQRYTSRKKDVKQRIGFNF